MFRTINRIQIRKMTSNNVFKYQKSINQLLIARRSIKIVQGPVSVEEIAGLMNQK